MRLSRNSVSLAIIFAGALLAQSAGVEGQVSEALHGRPIPKVMITLRGTTASGNPPQVDIYTTETDGQGRFAIRNVVPGRYTVSPSRSGFVPDWTESTGAIQSPPALQLEAGRTATVALRMNLTGVISGRVLDLDGDPIRDANVQAMQYIYASGKRQLTTRGSATTNDRGEYRLFNLPPGSYYLQAAHQSRSAATFFGTEIRDAQPPRGDVATFFPNAREAAGAAPLQLPPGGELSAIDIRMQNEALFTVRIKLPVQQGPPTPQPSFNLQPRAGSPGASPSSGTYYTNNAIEFRGVQPGPYMLTGTWRVPGQTDNIQSFARQSIDIARDIEINMPEFNPGFNVDGIVRFESTSSLSLAHLRVMLRPDETAGYIPQPNSSAEGGFQLKQVLPESYHISAAPIPEGAYLKSIKFGERELPDLRLDFSRGTAPIIITLATDGGRIEGTVQNDAGEPQPRHRVLLVPDGAQRTREDRLKNTLTDPDGHYKFADIPPGDYRLYAWASDDPAVLDPDVRKPHEQESTLVQVTPNSKATIVLRPISVER